MKHLIPIALLFGGLAQAVGLLPADITHDTACGAPGVGYEGIRSSSTERLVQKQQPGLRVSGSGWWVACAMPPACPEKATAPWEAAMPRHGKLARCAPGISSIRAGKIGDKRTVIDRDWQGRQTWQCTSVGWTLIDAYCR